MKTLLTAALSCILTLSALGYDREAAEYLKDWSDHQNELDEQRQAQARQQDAIEDIRWEMEERRRQSIANARIREENARRAELQRQQQIAALRRIEQQQRNLAIEVERRRRCAK